MKKQLLLLVLAVVLAFSQNATSQEYALSTPFGYGANATGGSGGTIVTATTASQLQTYLKQSGSLIILVSGEISLSDYIKVQVSNKTVIGLPGSSLTNTSTTASSSGILYLQNGSKNVILRNLTFIGPGAYDIDGRDNLCIDGGTDIWVDHCDFQDGLDGNFDNKGNADNITVSWCRFRYLKDPISGGSGGTDDHRFSNLLGSGSTDKPADGLFSFTWAYCWWDEGCKERMLRCRNAELDFISCYWNSSVANYYIGPQNASVYGEGCYFQGLNESRIFYENYGGTNSCKFVDSYGSVNGVPGDQGTVSAPSYDYTAFTTSDTKNFISSACGAGATLSVDSSTGEVYADCESRLGTPSTFSTTSTTSSITINWNAIDNADGYVVNFCSPSAGANVTDVTAVLDNTTKTDDYFVLSSGDKLHTVEGTAGNSSTACTPEGFSGTIYRTSSENDFVLELAATDDVTTITFGARSSGSDRDLNSYTINGGNALTTGIDGNITAQTCTSEITISGLNLSAGDKIAFSFSGNVQMSYFKLSNGVTMTCEEITVNTNSYTASGLTENATYYYQVKATDSSNEYLASNYSSERSAIADGSSTSIIKTYSDYSMLQYNNTIEVQGLEVVEMTVYNITGNKLLNNTFSQTLSLDKVNNGLYILVFKTTDGQLYSRKVIKK